MHERSLIRGLLNKLETLALEEGARAIRTVEVELGALCHMSPAHFREHFDREAPGTVAEGAALHIVENPDIQSGTAASVLLRQVEVEPEA